MSLKSMGVFTSHSGKLSRSRGNTCRLHLGHSLLWVSPPTHLTFEVKSNRGHVIQQVAFIEECGKTVEFCQLHEEW